MPRLFTNTSTAGYSRASACASAAAPRSPAKPITVPPLEERTAETAASTASAERPLTITCAPSRARAAAIACPIPAVLPVTNAVLPRSWRSIGCPPDLKCLFHGRAVELVDHAVLHDEAHPFHDADIGQRIARHRDPVGDLARRHAAQILVVPQKLRGVHRRGLKREHGRHAGLHHELELMRILSMRIYRGVRAE